MSSGLTEDELSCLNQQKYSGTEFDPAELRLQESTLSAVFVDERRETQQQSSSCSCRFRSVLFRVAFQVFGMLRFDVEIYPKINVGI